MARAYDNYHDVIVSIEIELRRRRPGGPGEGTVYRRSTANQLNLIGRDGQANHIRQIVDDRVTEFLDTGLPETGRAEPKSGPDADAWTDESNQPHGYFDDETSPDAGRAATPEAAPPRPTTNN